MSKLKNAPLLEVIFELRWRMLDKSHWEKYPYLQGDLYTFLKERYPIRELLVSGEVPQELLVNKPIYRFKNKNRYPLFQVGPGLLTLNTIEEKYNWQNYSKDIEELCEVFFKVYDFENEERVIPSLSYFDFLKVDWKENNVLEYISENLNLKVEKRFYMSDNPPNSFSWNIGYPTSLGNITLRIDAGSNNKKEKGLIVQTQLIGLENEPKLTSLRDWLNDAHEVCSKLFKDLTQGSLYNSFS